MICTKCGRELQEGVMFCGYCGAYAGFPEIPEYDLEYSCGEMTEEDRVLFGDENNGETGSFDDSEEPPIAWCNGNGLGKSEVIEFLEKVVDIQTGEEECKRIMEGLDMEYRDAANRIPPEPMRERPAIRLKKGIIGIIVGLAICNIWIDSMIAGIISFMIIIASAWIFLAKPIVDKRKKYAAELTMYNNGIAECEEIRENCRNAYGVVRELGKICGESLDACYNTEIIKPKYRNLPACAFILEQLENGLTNTLTFEPGDKGAYNKWEDQLYRKAVIGNLDDIRDTVHNIDGKLDVVIQNQHLLYDKVNEINQNVDRVVKELVQIKSFSALTAMNTDQMKHTLRNIEGITAGIQANTESMEWAQHCIARNTSKTISQDLRYKTGLDFYL